ncbi:MAG: NAD+ synthase [Candidatus Zixiibacteriota bacterium]
MKVTLAQLNPLVGDISGNLARVKATVSECARNSDLVIFSELFLVGYPPQDLLDRPSFVEGAEKALIELQEFSAGYPDTGIIVGAPLRNERPGEKRLVNAAPFILNGEIIQAQGKCHLPSYDVFDEARYFQPACSVSIVDFKGERVGVSVCEDAWTDPSLWPRGEIYDRDPVSELAGAGATLLINISGSPFSAGKETIRYRLLSEHARHHGLPLVFVNQVGGNDELLFDGRSMSFDREGIPTSVLASFHEQIETIDTLSAGKRENFTPLEEIDSIHGALVMGLRDYMDKCGFTKCVVGVSGGIDSAVTLALAVEAAGAEKTLGITMPSAYSTSGSIADSRELAQNLGVELKTIPIHDTYQCFLSSLSSSIDISKVTVTQENLQARIRGNILMAYSNEFGYLPLSTGNKSELAVGYCTLYGDMSGGLSMLGDAPKTKVYELASFMNREREIIPQAILDKPPSAELRPDHTDQDTLPEYETLDAILAGYVEEERSVAELVAEGFDESAVHWVARAVHNNEYKRRQAAPALRVTSKSFGGGRRMPIAAKYDT